MCDIIQPCSNQKIIADAFKNAKAWLPVAQKAMEEYMLAAQRWLSDPKKVPKLSSKAARALKANFGWTEDERLKKENLGGLYPNTPRNVIKVIGTLRAKIDVRFAAECGPAMVHPALNPKHAGDLSKVMAFSMQEGKTASVSLLTTSKQIRSDKRKPFSTKCVTLGRS